MKNILGYIDSGKKEGASLLTGGARHGSEGYFVQPTVFGDVQDDMKICREVIEFNIRDKLFRFSMSLINLKGFMTIFRTIMIL